MSQTVKAKLDRRTGGRLMCGGLNNTCEFQFGTSTAVNDEWTAREAGIDSIIVRDIVIRLDFTPQSDGIWRQSNHARDRRPESGQAIKPRRIGKPSIYMPGMDPRDHTNMWRPDLPIQAECPQCGATNEISWEGLGTKEVS